jgi:hypothetical protein
VWEALLGETRWLRCHFLWSFWSGLQPWPSRFTYFRVRGRSEGLGEDRYELLRGQYNRLELLHELRQTLIEELEWRSRECSATYRNTDLFLPNGMPLTPPEWGCERNARCSNSRA